ncbi:MAG: SHOCT domain-containing protein [Limnohabitans sp.]
MRIEMLKILLGFFFSFLLALVSVTTFIYSKESGFLSALPSLFISSLLGYFSWIRFKNRRVELDLKSKKSHIVKIKEKTKKELLHEAMHKTIEVKYLGGTGYGLREAEIYAFGLMNEKIRFVSNDSEAIDIDFTDISTFEVGGLGTTTTNAGISGGGFGIEGFIKGAVTAAVINAATTKSATNTLLRITSRVGEVFLHTSTAEPEELRMILSPLSVSISKKTGRTTVSFADELSKLNELLKSGVISEIDFENAKNKLLK